jgi:uncharacterized protein (TIGR03437 family)
MVRTKRVPKIIGAVFLWCGAVAWPQGVTLSPTSANIPSQGGSGGVNVSTGAEAHPWSAVSSQPWLTVTSGASGTGNGLVQYNAEGNPAGIARTASIKVTLTDSGTFANFQLTQEAGSLSLSPNTVNVPASGGSNAIQTVTNNPALQWTAVSSQAWLTITAGASGTGQSTIQFTVAGNPGGASRTAAINVTPSGGSPVTATVTQQGGVLVVSPSSANVPGSGGTGSINLSTDNPALLWNATSDQTWLTITAGSSGAGSGTVQWSAAANTSTSGRTGHINIAVAGAQTQVFVVNEEAGTTSAALVANPSSLAFSAQNKAGPPDPATVTITVQGGAAVQVTASANTASGGNWLAVSGGGSTPAVLTVTVSPSALAPGMYQGTITATAANNAATPVTVQVTLTVTAAPTISANPSHLQFAYQQQGPVPAAQQFSVTSSGAAVAFSASPSPGASWLQVSASGTTPGSVPVRVDPSGLAAGTYQGTVSVSAGGAQNTPLLVPVTLTVNSAPNLMAAPSAVSFQYQQGASAPPAIDVAITSTGAPLQISASASKGFIHASVASATTPTTIHVSVDPAGLSPGAYTGEVLVSSPAAGNSPLSIPVTLKITPAPTLIVAPNALPFYAQTGAASIPPKTLRVSATSPVDFQSAVQTSSGGTWLSISRSSGTTPATLIVTAQANALAAGVYNGTITITSGQAANSPQQVLVTLTISSPPPLLVTPGQMQFSYQLGSTVPSAQTLTVTTGTGPAAPVTATATAAGGGNWLSIEGGGQTPTTLQVSVRPAGLAPGLYEGMVRVDAPGYQSASLPVTLQVTTSVVIGVFPSSISFGYQQNSSLPPPRTVSVASLPPGVAFAVEASSDKLHVTVNGSGLTPGSFSLSVDPTGLAPGTYSANVDVVSPEASNSPVSVPVKVTVTAAPVISATPASVHFSATQSGGPPPTQALSIGSSGGALDFTYSVSAGASWLTVTGSGPTPTTLTLSVDQAGLSPGDYQASILIQSPGAGNSPLTIPVSLTVDAAPLLQAKPPAFVFAFEVSKGLPASRTLTVTSSGATLPVRAVSSTNSGGNWLSITGGGNTPANFTVTASPAGLSPGAYHGTITVTGDGAANSPLTLPVTLIVSPSPVLNVSPGEADFSYQIGQAAPASQQIQVTSSGLPLPFQTAAATDSGGNWVTVSSGGTAPAVVDIRVDPSGLAPATYTGRVIISSAGAGNSPVTVPLTLTVTRAIALSASPASLTFTYQAGSATPAARQVTITSGGTPIGITTSIGKGAPWLAATGGTVTPATLSVTVDPAGLSPGSYDGLILVQSDSAANSPLQIPVTLNVVQAPSLSVSPASLAFVAQAGGPPPAAQPVAVTSSGAALDFQSTVSEGASWLKVSGGSGTTPGSIQISVDSASLPAGNYAGTVLISSSSSNSTALVPVTLTISAGPTLSVFPANLNFAYQIGGSQPPRRFLLVTGGGGTAAVSASSMTFAGGDWLSVSGGGSTPFLLTSVVNPMGLAAGVYSGQISLTAPGATNSPLNVPVTLTVTAAAVLSAEPESLSFAFTAGTPAPPSQQVTISSSSPVSIALNTSTTDGAGWLTAQAAGNTTPVIVTVSVNPTGLFPGIYSGSFTVSSPAAGNSPLVIPVSFQVSAAPVLNASPPLALFSYTIGGASPAPIPIQISSTATTSVSTSVSQGTPWLSVSGGGPTPATLTLTVNVAGLAEGPYQGAVLVTAPGAANSPLSIPVTLTVQGGNSLVVSPTTLSFQLSAQSSGSSQLQVLSSGNPLAFAATASPGTPWLTASASGTTPQSIQVVASAAGLTPGIYQGSVVITASGAANSPLTVPVRMEVQAAPLLSANPRAVVLSYGSGRSGTLTEIVSMTLDGKPAVNIEVSPLTAGFPMTVTPGSSGTFKVEVDPTRLPIGTYLSGVQVVEPTAANSPFIVPVELQVTRLFFNVTPGSIALASAAGTTTSSIIRIDEGAQVFDAAVTGSTWLKVSPTTGTAPANLTVIADPGGLRTGTYLGSVAIISQAVPKYIPVTLEVRDASALSVSPKRLVFRYSSGGTTTPAVALAVDGAPAPLPVQVSAADSWLSAIPAGGSTPTMVNVSVSPAGLASGTYRSTVTIQAGGQAGTVVVPVELYVDQPSAPVIASILNGASFLATPLSPGEIFSVFGSGLGPSASVSTGPVVNTSLGGVEVLINGVLTPLLYVSSSQINAIVPYGVDRAIGANVVVRFQGIDSAPAALKTVASAPAIFSQASNGLGSGSILNQDLSTNTPANPAVKGSIVAVFGSGEGQTTPPGLDGVVAVLPLLPKPLLSVSAQVGGIAAEVTYAGAAPGFAAGSLQINVRIPPNAPAGATSIQIKIGEVVSQSGLTVSIR